MAWLELSLLWLTPYPKRHILKDYQIVQQEVYIFQQEAWLHQGQEP